jgi:PH domain
MVVDSFFFQLAGFLQKKGAKGMIKGWKKRFFILFPDNIIRYYDEFGFINLNDVEEVRPSNSGDHLFEVVTPTRVYELQGRLWSASEVGRGVHSSCLSVGG